MGGPHQRVKRGKTMVQRPVVSFPNLDGLRTVAFLVVFMQHGFYGWAADALPAVLAEKFFYRGDIGVQFFFVLSGFLITYLLLTELAATGTISIPRFYLRRALRIWPLYYALLAVYLLVFPILQRHPTEVRSWPFLVFLGNFEVVRSHHLGLSMSMCMAVMWSIAVEEQFYAVWPLAARFVRRSAFPILCGLICLASLLFRVTRKEPEIFHSAWVVSDLALGSLAAYLMSEHASLRRGVERLGASWIVIAYVCGAGLVLFFPDRLVVGIFFAFVVVEQCFASNSFYKMSRSRLLTSGGKYTYGLYLIHPLAITIAVQLTHSTFGTGAIALLLSIILSVISYELYEARFLRLKERFASVSRHSGASSYPKLATDAVGQTPR